MTFTTRIKDEITKIETNVVESLTELLIYLKFNGDFQTDKITIIIENASVARRIFKLLKENYGININLTIRRQNKLKKRILYILTIKEKVQDIQKDTQLVDEYTLDSFEEKASFLKGVFLACGSINDPKSGSYHAEFLVKNHKDAKLINKVLHSLKFNSRILKRERGYMIYLKSAEEISDVIRILGAMNSLFYFEDIRIYRDHKNMVNRLNNCEQANVEKVFKTAQEQIIKINYLKENDLIELLDDKTKIIIEYRIKYPESSFQELAEIISLETNFKISKSGVNHHFRKISQLVERHQKNK